MVVIPVSHRCRVANGCVVQGCLNAATGHFGIGDDIVVGPPAVLSPSRGDTWLISRTARVQWSTAGRNLSVPVLVRLWENTNCVDRGGVLVATLAAGVFPSGSIQYRLPPSFAKTGTNFYVEVKDRWVFSQRV